MNSTNNSPKVLEDVKINVKLKLSALWITAMLCYAYGDIVGFYRRGMLKEIVAGNMGPLVQLRKDCYWASQYSWPSQQSWFSWL